MKLHIALRLEAGRKMFEI